MEHRWGTRKPVLQDVCIRDETGVTSHGKINNINHGGMYIQIDLHGIKKGSIIDLEAANGRCIRGWVVHVQTNGIGIMFVSSNFSPCEQLLEQFQ